MAYKAKKQSTQKHLNIPKTEANCTDTQIEILYAKAARSHVGML
jgi:hypothetical protein